jgi:hypothetical protein
MQQQKSAFNTIGRLKIMHAKQQDTFSNNLQDNKYFNAKVICLTARSWRTAMISVGSIGNAALYITHSNQVGWSALQCNRLYVVV